MGNKIIGILGLILAAISILVAVANPEIRDWFGLNASEQTTTKKEVGKKQKNLLKQEKQNNYYRLVKSAEKQYKLGDYSAAKALYQEALNYIPNGSEALNGLIKCDKVLYAPPPSRHTPSIRRLLDDLVYVRGGTFEMGCTEEQKECERDETPSHTVTVGDFNIGKYEVTQDQWQAVMGSNPSWYKDCGSRCPVEDVSWNDVRDFIQKLNQITNKTFRLPTEAEWEYAARNRGKKTLYSGTNSESSLYLYANFCDASCMYTWKDESQNDNYGGTAPVGKFSPNALGLYDMSGNVWEWCQGWYDDYSNEQLNPKESSKGFFCVLRGGSFFNKAGNCRVSYRRSYAPDHVDISHGFRVASSIE